MIHDSDELNNYAVQNSGSNGAPYDQLEKKELYEIIDMLPGAYGRPIRMFLAGYSYKEISKSMKIPIGTVKSRIHLGKKQIRTVYTA